MQADQVPLLTSDLPADPQAPLPEVQAELDDARLLVLLEALLFVTGEPAPLARLATALAVAPERVEAALNQLAQQCEGRGMRVQRHRDAVQLVSAPEAADAIETFLGLDLTTKLSRAALETLAIIAYRQPITRPQIDAIRGVNSDGVMRTLLNRGLLEEVGRLEQAGRPILYGTTFEFLQYFGLSDLSQLPPLEEEAIAQMAERVEMAEPGPGTDEARADVRPLLPDTQQI